MPWDECQVVTAALHGSEVEGNETTKGAVVVAQRRVNDAARQQHEWATSCKCLPYPAKPLSSTSSAKLVPSLE